MTDVTPQTAAAARHPTPILMAVADLGYRLWCKAVLHRLERRAVSELSRMSEAQLRDIGLRREDIPHAVHGRATARRDL